MDGLQAFVELVKALAWPLGAYLIARMFKVQIAELLRNVRLKSLKGPGGVSAEFTEQVSVLTIKAQAAVSQPVPDAPEIREAADRPETKTAVQWWKTRRELAVDSNILHERPSAIVLGAWQMLEALMTDCVEMADDQFFANPKNKANRRAWIEFLFHHGFLDEKTADVLHKLHDLRQDVAILQFEPESHAALEYYRTAVMVQAKLTTALEKALSS